MKITYSRRYRRSSSRSRENSTFKKDNHHEHTFFSSPSNDSFFKPKNSVMRKCDHCAAEDKKVSRVSDSKEEDKKVQKMDEKKEDKAVQKMEDKKEEKEVHKMNDKKEEKEIYKMDDKKEEKEIHKTEDKKEEKEVHKMGNEKEEEKKVAKKANAAETSAAQSSSYVQTLDSKGQALPEDAQHFFGERMGHDFSAVKIHTGTEAEQSAKDLNAKAYAVDHNIVFNKGQYNPESTEGRKLLAHELAHIIQNKKARKINRKEQNPEKEKSVTISGTSTIAKSKKAYGSCEGVDVHGQTDFSTLPSAFRIQATPHPSTECNCSAPDRCITVSGTIISTFRSKIKVTLPPVPSGLSRCETNALRSFINTTLRNHEQQHVAAFRTYNGMVQTPFTYTGCRSGLQAFVQSIHDGIDAQRSADAIAQSDALDPFVAAIPCECE